MSTAAGSSRRPSGVPEMKYSERRAELVRAVEEARAYRVRHQSNPAERAASDYVYERAQRELHDFDMATAPAGSRFTRDDALAIAKFLALTALAGAVLAVTLWLRAHHG